MLGLTLDKLVVVGVVAAFLLGPSRLPGYAAALGAFVRRMRSTADGLKARVSEEIGEDIDWTQLDPRRYDPRAIVRGALLDTVDSVGTARAADPERTPHAGEGT